MPATATRTDPFVRICLASVPDTRVQLVREVSRFRLLVRSMRRARLGIWSEERLCTRSNEVTVLARVTGRCCVAFEILKLNRKVEKTQTRVESTSIRCE